MFAKLLLPRLGGAPAVWIVSAAFFQMAVLLGYLYAHALARLPSLRRQAYPCAVAPRRALPARSWAWSAGYLCFVVLACACAGRAWHAPMPLPVPAASSSTARDAGRLRWAFLAFVPASLYLGFTTWA